MASGWNAQKNTFGTDKSKQQRHAEYLQRQARRDLSQQIHSDMARAHVEQLKKSESGRQELKRMQELKSNMQKQDSCSHTWKDSCFIKDDTNRAVKCCNDCNKFESHFWGSEKQENKIRQHFQFL